MLHDTHTHLAPYSNDASQTIWQLLEQSDRLGLASVCTAEHFEKDVFYAQGREDIYDLDNYFTKMQPIKNTRPEGSARLFLGIELGYLPHLADHLAKVVRSYPFDSVIFSLHFLKGEDPFTDKSLYCPAKAAVYSQYLKTMVQMTLECPDFDILGHFDYISRYAPYPDKKMRYAEIPEAFDELLKTLVSACKALEINTKSIQSFRQMGYPVEDAWPDPAIILRYLELGGNLVSLGSDAHNPGEAGMLLGETAQWLKTLGLNQLVHFENRLPIHTAI